MPAGTNFCTTAQTPWRVPAKYSNAVWPRVEDRLRGQRVALVDVEERLVLRVVREHQRVNGERCRARDPAGR